MHISKNDLMSKLPYQQIIILISLQNIIFKTDALYVSLKDLSSEMKWICGSMQINFNTSLMAERLNDLEQYGMITVRRRVNAETQIILQVSSNDVRAALADN